MYAGFDLIEFFSHCANLKNDEKKMVLSIFFLIYRFSLQELALFLEKRR
jgi:hypothetical protein